MSESGFERPRRAFAHDTDSKKPIADDDTPVSAASAARRGQDPEASDSPEVTAGSDSPRPPNPFARPGSEAATSEVPTVGPLVPPPVVPASEGVGTTGASQFVPGSAGGSASETESSPASSATSPDSDEQATSPVQSESWMRHHRKTLLLFLIGALVVALFVVVGSFWAGRSTQSPPPPIASSSPSPSTSVSEVPAVSVDDLLTLEDAEAIVADATWSIARTAETREEAQARPACLGSDIADVNPTDTFQRGVGTSGDDMLAAFHQVDLYATVDAAQQVQSERATNLAACDDVPAVIVGSSTITGIGDEATQLTVAFQGDPDEGESEVLHSVILVRTGRALTMLDVTRNDEVVPAEDALAGMVRSLGGICERVDGTCPTDPTANPTVPPPVDPEGWLITSDLPRIRPGYGQWITNEEQPVDITSSGMGCENMTLATEPGPTQRQQRTYLLTQDEETPTTFGIDEMVFDFEDNVAARGFTNKLIDSLLSCEDRNATAQVTDWGAINGTGADDVAVSARMIVIDQAISDDSAVKYQLAVAIADTRVSYLLTSVTEDYRFTKNAQHELSLRMAQRNSQG